MLRKDLIGKNFSILWPVLSEAASAAEIAANFNAQTFRLFQSDPLRRMLRDRVPYRARKRPSRPRHASKERTVRRVVARSPRSSNGSKSAEGSCTYHHLLPSTCLATTEMMSNPLSHAGRNTAKLNRHASSRADLTGSLTQQLSSCSSARCDCSLCWYGCTRSPSY